MIPQRTEHGEPRTENQELRTENGEPRTGNQEQGAEKRESRSGNRAWNSGKRGMHKRDLYTTPMLAPWPQAVLIVEVGMRIRTSDDQSGTVVDVQDVDVNSRPKCASDMRQRDPLTCGSMYQARVFPSSQFLR